MICFHWGRFGGLASGDLLGTERLGKAISRTHDTHGIGTEESRVARTVEQKGSCGKRWG